ncbi:hypothetical protein [Alteribacillus sp. YIM 98480]|uniref:hypothetical protein n=1 Tax=Alteribacillus sp. YIM 98480 TaxID=2606599 RepID=UPI00131DB0C6|nr:hypothetical protein [Alteribacillus sp. YIM 98480]
MSSASVYSLEIPSVRQWKAKISFPYAAPPGVVAREQGACAFLRLIGSCDENCKKVAEQYMSRDGDVFFL